MLHQQLENDMLQMQNEAERRMQWMQQVCQTPPHHLNLSSGAIQSVPPATPSEMLLSRRQMGNFELALDVDQVPPEELTVRTEGRRLIVTGKHYRKRETENGSFVHEYRECHKEADLPEDVNPGDVTCSVSRDGRLLFRAPRLALPAAEQRMIPVNRDMHIPIMVESRRTLH
ncbi:PREDICTED: heat shock protein 30C-like [Nanorana parkeri]|uniref:heat shock protein 30C-like n=1 Tax=Nanorana parkeri TaxID=125878 RepID=UPI0008549E9E|nr:PREDICTED: heat shock protein 30C-like [Nanorana parkeri]